MKQLTALDDAIAKQSGKLQRTRRRIQRHKIALRNNALEFCRRPSTLAAAFVAGFTLASLSHYPMFQPMFQRAAPTRFPFPGIVKKLRMIVETSVVITRLVDCAFENGRRSRAARAQ
jgi:hypothetical protein